MDSKWTGWIDQLQNVFPESDRVVLAALIDKRDAARRYLAQVSDLTLGEVAEGIDRARTAFATDKTTVIAAE